MKPLAELINVEKARLLHQLFPGEIPAFLQYVQGVGASVLEHETEQRQTWDNGLFSFDFWLSLIREADSKIKRYGKRLHTGSKLFADQLFDGYLAFYMVHCLMLYTQTRQHPNRKFAIAVDLLFNP
ncbi:MAG: hypothetical protein H3C48_13370 [Chitinophagaceae bacterium]|nr:hypothetical protein [Chitinophagaceae bacterium]